MFSLKMMPVSLDRRRPSKYSLMMNSESRIFLSLTNAFWGFKMIVPNTSLKWLAKAWYNLIHLVHKANTAIILDIRCPYFIGNQHHEGGIEFLLKLPKVMKLLEHLHDIFLYHITIGLEKIYVEAIWALFLVHVIVFLNLARTNFLSFPNFANQNFR